MKYVVLFLILLLVISLVSCSKTADLENDLETSLPIGYSLDNYTIVEVLDVNCDISSTCQTPAGYLVMSNCPYTSLCLENKCTVICPRFS